MVPEVAGSNPVFHPIETSGSCPGGFFIEKGAKLVLIPFEVKNSMRSHGGLYEQVPLTPDQRAPKMGAS